MDPISNMLTAIRNASRAKKSQVILPYSRMKSDMLRVLKQYGFVADFQKSADQIPMLTITLHPDRQDLALDQISKSGQRQYVQHKELKKVKNGLGISIVSTSQGVMSNIEAYQKRLGGELLCQVY